MMQRRMHCRQSKPSTKPFLRRSMRPHCGCGWPPKRVAWAAVACVSLRMRWAFRERRSMLGWPEASKASKKRGAASAAAGKSTLRVRAAGGGRKKLIDLNLGLLDALDALVEPTSRGDPMSPLRWTCKGTTRLSLSRTRQSQPLCGVRSRRK